MDMLVQVFMWTYVVVVFFLDKYLGVQLLGHCWLILEEIQNRFQNVCTILNFFCEGSTQGFLYSSLLLSELI